MLGAMHKCECQTTRSFAVNVRCLPHRDRAEREVVPLASCTSRPRVRARIGYAMDRTPISRLRAGSARPAQGEHALPYRQSLSPLARPHSVRAFVTLPHEPVWAQAAVPVPARPTRASALQSHRARPTSRSEAAQHRLWFAASRGHRPAELPVRRMAVRTARACGHSVARNVAADGRPESVQPRTRWPRRIGRDLDAYAPRGDATLAAVPAGCSLPKVRADGSPRGSRWAETREFKNLRNVMHFTTMGALHYDRRLADFVQLVIANVGSFGGLCREMDCSAHSSRVCTSTFSVYSA